MMREREHDWNLDRDNRIIHDEEFGEDNVELVDAEWKDFENFLRYFSHCPLTILNLLNLNF